MTSTTMFVPSPQQATIFDWIVNGTGSAVIEAVAGAGKTTTLVESLTRTTGQVAFSAFNRAIATEIGDRVKPLGLGTRVKTGTLHSFGFAALKNAYPKTKLEGNKMRIIADKAMKKNFLKTFAINAASMAKQVGIGIICPINDDRAWVKMVNHYSLQDVLPIYANLEEAIGEAQLLLDVSNKNVATLIDFDDMIYVPVLKKLNTRKYDWVFLDEAQDTNTVRRKLVSMMLASNGRLVAVGDTHQAIYGFTGADYRSMESICEEFNAVKMPLTTTYRCPKLVVEVANQWVNHIEAAETAPDGVVDSSDIETLIKNSEFTSEDAILCRKTKPLVDLAFKLIQSGIACKVEGRSIGKGLIKLINNWKLTKISELDDKLTEWSDREISKARAKGHNDRCDSIEDQAETIRVLVDQCDYNAPITDLITHIESLFGDSGSKQDILTLSTIHRAKGREWNRVFALGMESYSPSRWARKPWEMTQEDNLCYVQVTRAKRHLTLVRA